MTTIFFPSYLANLKGSTTKTPYRRASVCPSAYRSICLPASLSVFNQSFFLSICLPACRSADQSFCLSVLHSVCLSQPAGSIWKTNFGLDPTYFSTSSIPMNVIIFESKTVNKLLQKSVFSLFQISIIC